MPVVTFFTGAKQLTIDLAEPVVILRGTSNDKITHVLEGEVNVVLTRPMLASNVIIKFIGKSHMLWPEGKQDQIKIDNFVIKFANISSF